MPNTSILPFPTDAAQLTAENERLRLALVAKEAELSRERAKWETASLSLLPVLKIPTDYHLEVSGGRWISVWRAMEEGEADALATYLAGIAFSGRIPKPNCYDSDCRESLARCTYCDDCEHHHYNERCRAKGGCE